MSGAYEIAVVVSTFERAEMLAELLTSLAAQRLPRSAFEVVVVDDSSQDGTGEVLARELARDRLDLRTLCQPRRGFQAAARNRGWRTTQAPLIAFTDDDCVADPGWLTAMIDAARDHPGAFIQGRTAPRPDQVGLLGPFARCQDIPGPNDSFQTCNILYPREMLERLDGFDEASFAKWGGEDTDLAWRALEGGAQSRFTGEALIYHAVRYIGPRGALRLAAGWGLAVRAVARHPGLRDRFPHRIFWNMNHRRLAIACAGLLLPRRLGALRLVPALPTLHETATRADRLFDVGLLRSAAFGPWYLLSDIVEAAGVARAAARERILMV